MKLKLKLKREELHALMNGLRACDEVTFATTLESRVCGALVRDFALKIAKKAVEMQVNLSIGIDTATAHALNHVLPQLEVVDQYTQVVVQDIHQIINKACLSS